MVDPYIEATTVALCDHLAEPELESLAGWTVIVRADRAAEIVAHAKARYTGNKTLEVEHLPPAVDPAEDNFGGTTVTFGISDVRFAPTQCDLILTTIYGSKNAHSEKINLRYVKGKWIISGKHKDGAW